MYRPGAVHFVTLGRLARVRAEADRRPYCRTGLGLKIKPIGIDRIAARGSEVGLGWVSPNG